MKKNREFTENEKEIYRLGYLNAESRLQRSIDNIKATNRHLMDEVLRLDLDKPVVGDPKHITITVTVMFIEKTIKVLRSKLLKKTGQHYAAALQKHLNNYKEEQRKFAERIEKGLIQSLE